MSDSEQPMFELSVVLRGPERTIETNYGERTERDDLARLEVPITGARGWQIYAGALGRVIEPDAVVKFPASLSEEEAERIRREWREARS